MPTMKLSDLTLGSEIGEGANAYIYEVVSTNGQAVAARPIVFKKYKSSPKKIELENIAELIRFRDALSIDDRALLDSAILWPIALVADGPRIVGNVMERLPDEAMKTTGGKTEAIGVFTLMGREKYCPASHTKGRLKIVAGLVYCVAVLHRLGVVYGDLSQSNAVLLAKSGGVLLIDSDVCKVPMSPVDFVQGHTPPLTPPEQRGKPLSQSTLEGDVFKLSEMAARILLNRAQLVDPDEVYDALLATYGQSVADGIGFGLSLNPADRRSAWEVYSVVYNALASLVRPPELRSVTLSPYGVIEGQAVTVSWEGVGILEVDVLGPCGEQIRVPVGQTSVAVPARATGRFEVIARNNEGEVSVMSPRLICVDRPAVHSVEVPELFEVTSAISGMTYGAVQHVVAAVEENVAGSTLGMPFYQEGIHNQGMQGEIAALPSLSGVFDGDMRIEFDKQLSLGVLDSARVNRILQLQLEAVERAAATIRRVFTS